MDAAQGMLVRKIKPHLTTAISFASVVIALRVLARWSTSYGGSGPLWLRPGWTKLADFFMHQMPTLIGGGPRRLSDFNITSSLTVGHSVVYVVVIAWLIVLVATCWRWQPLERRELDGMSAYLVLVGMGQAAAFIALSPYPGDRMVVRYLLLILLALSGLVAIAWRRPVLRGVTAGVILLMTAFNLAGNVRLIHEYAGGPEPRALNLLAEALMQRGVRYVETDYWTAFDIAWVTGERVIASPQRGSGNRVVRYNDELDAHRGEVFTIGTTPGPGCEAIVRWQLCPPAGGAAGHVDATPTPAPVSSACGRICEAFVRTTDMPLASGTRLGPYEIVSALGAGGMGEVYRARDTRLDRTVAIKVLPATLASDPSFRERFDREARSISALDHPNICAVYDVGHDRGIDFIVMAFVEGETLAARLERGPLKLDEALRYAMEIASALEQAHRAGIVHRDVKPGNVMLTTTGAGSTSAPQAKLLDFGLAKRAGPAAAGGLTAMPTTPAELTAAGAILGTFQYMAPEQLEGEDADARSDIFAFGAVVYEMVTGRKAFEARSRASLISAILRDEPLPLASDPRTRGLERVIRRCLAKSPNDRWQTASDLLEALRWVRDGGGYEETAATPRARSRMREAIAWTLAGTLALALVSFAAWVWMKPTVVTGSRSSVDPRRPAKRCLGAGVAIAPDGSSVVFPAITRGYVTIVPAANRPTRGGSDPRNRRRRISLHLARRKMGRLLFDERAQKGADRRRTAVDHRADREVPPRGHLGSERHDRVRDRQLTGSDERASGWRIADACWSRRSCLPARRCAGRRGGATAAKWCSPSGPPVLKPRASARTRSGPARAPQSSKGRTPCGCRLASCCTAAAARCGRFQSTGKN